MKYLLLSLLLLLPSCRLVLDQSMQDTMTDMKDESSKGCGYVAGQGTPPASRIDGGVIVVWGSDMDVAKCAEELRKFK